MKPLPVTGPPQECPSDAAGPGRTIVVANPIATRYKLFDRLLSEESERLGFSRPPVFLTSRDDGGRKLARRATKSGISTVIVAGGDGTVRQVAAGLAGSSVSMAVVPIGTGNVLARNLRLSSSRIRDAVRIALQGTCRPVDLGWAELHVSGGSESREPFLSMVGFGHDADAVASVSAPAKRGFGWSAYFLAGARQLRQGLVPMRVSDCAHSWQGEAWTALVGQVPRVPPGVAVFPDARLDDGRLQLLVVTAESIPQWLSVAAAGLSSGAVTSSRLEYRRGHAFSLNRNSPGTVQVDGDWFRDVTRVKVELQPAAVWVRVRGNAVPATAVSG